MSEQEKFEQVGKLAEEVSHLKGELNHINEKLQRAFAAYNRIIQGQNIQNWSVQNGKIVVPSTPYGGAMPQPDLNDLLGSHELKEILEKRQKLTSELNEAVNRLKGLAPHLF